MPCGLRPNLPFAVLLCATLIAPPTTAQQATGVADPTVAWGLSRLADWETAMPILDIARLMRPFFGFSGDKWEAMDHNALAAGGFLDANGYALRIPPGLAGIRTIWAWDETFGADRRKGLYILTYEGRGTVTLGGAAEVVNTAPGRIIFENPTGASFWLDITSTDPGNHLRAISVLRADHVALAEAGMTFNPDWLARIQDARELRFMDWMSTTNASATQWDDRPDLADATWTDTGAPVEVLVRLANETGTDPWFTMPHKADDDYNRQFATYVRDNLDPRLKAHVEYSNETWNASFEQFHWLREQAIADWGSGVSEDWEAIFSYHTKRATHVAQIWEDVFAAEAPTRLVNVLGTQLGNAWVTERHITAPGWMQHDPGSYVDPATVFEEVAATSYFGGSFMVDADLRTELTARMHRDGDRAYSWLFELVSQDGPLEDSIPAILRNLSEQRALANAHDMRLTLYEGGQHMHHSFAIDGLSDAEADELGRFLAGFVRSPEMGALYEQLWDGWREIGEGPFMQFTEAGSPSRWGSWGIIAFPGDRNPRASFVMKQQAAGGSWWGEEGGPQYLHGTMANGSESADEMTGTDEEDFLAGLGGDDRFIASPGRDGINGGDGTDTYILPDPADKYTIAAEGAGFRVTGPLGSAYLVHVELLTFGDGSTRALE